MSNRTCVVIDDEDLARLTLRNKLTYFPNIEVIGEANSIKEGMEVINNLKPDLLFLDIQLSDGTGFDLLNKLEFTGEIIFVTAYDEYAIRAFEINAVDYLLKPISNKRLKDAIEKLNKKLSTDSNVNIVKLNYDDRLMVTHKKSVNFIKINSIISINASREYSYVYTVEGKEYLTSKSISEWDNKLPDQNFCRVHRSTIINFDFINKINHQVTGTAEVFMQGLSEPLRISRNYFRKLKERYGL
jgi:two-component system LytT family response regulator